MHANLRFKITQPYQDFGGRLIQFMKNNIWLYIPDFILLTILALPPYEIQKALLVVTGLVILGFRDIIVLLRSKIYLNHFFVENKLVYYSVLKYSKLTVNKKVNISSINLDLQKTKKPYYLDIIENNKMIHRQYAIGYWSLDKLEQLYNSFSKLKKDLDLGFMFKGTSLN
jgi:hypothetical protein